MSTLSPCPSCNRHVRIADVTCPFCAAAMPARATAPQEASPRPRPRMSRAAIFAAGATLAGMAACSNTNNNPAEGGVGGTGGAHDGAAAADGSTGGTGGAHDGAAGASGASGAGGAAGSGGRGGSDAGLPTDGPIAIYSAAFPPGLSQT